MNFKVVLIISLVLFVIALGINVLAYFLEKSMNKKKKNIINLKNDIQK